MNNQLIIDYNQVVIATVSAGSKYFGDDLTIEMLRHLILNTIVSYRKKFRDYEDVIIACDGPNHWRRDHFPYYKAGRRKGRDESPLDWDLIFKAVNELRVELDTYFPYKVVYVNGAEGDDIIAVLTKHFQTEYDGLAPPKIKIISSDKDFRQLQIWDGVSQYSGIQKKEIVEPDPERYLFEQILRGDGGDGVPNFLSAGDTFVTGVRQRPLRQTRIDKCWEARDPQQFCSTDELNNYSRNKKMVDLVHEEIPNELVSEILQTYRDAPTPSKAGLLDYFIKFKLKNLMGELQNF